MHLSGQLNCRSLRCSWSIACRRCSNYIFILDLTPGFKWLCKEDFKTRWESFQFWDLVCLLLETLRYMNSSVKYKSQTLLLTRKQLETHECILSTSATDGLVLKLSLLKQLHIFQFMGKLFCVEFQRFPHKISHPYIKRCNFYTILKY